jgi:hypothetical protein
VACGRGRHDEELAAGEVDGAAGRICLGVEAIEQRGLERVGGIRHGQAAPDVVSAQERQAHRGTRAS